METDLKLPEELSDMLKDVSIKDAAKLSGAFGSVYAVLLLTLIALYSIFVGVITITASYSELMYSWSQFSAITRFVIISSALIGVPFAVLLIKQARNNLEIMGAILLFLSLFFYFGIAFLPTEVHPEHSLATLAWLVTFTLSSWVFGTGQVISGNTKIGLFSIWSGLFVVLVWISWMIVNVFEIGLLLPEYLGGVLAYGTFIAYLSWKFYKGELYS